MGMVSWMDRTLYPEHGANWDDSAFREVILGHLTGNETVLDLGAGAGLVEQMHFRGVAGRICGVDPDPRVLENPHLDEGKEGVGEAIPYPDDTFDVVFADNVLEHLETPDRVFAEVKRVLRAGGVFLAKTPNRRHYVPVIASLTPHGFHTWVNGRRGRDEEDTFPTRYRANTPSAVRRLAGEAGFSDCRITLVEGRPEYLRMSAPTYFAGWLYERTVNSFEALAPLRVILMAEMRA